MGKMTYKPELNSKYVLKKVNDSWVWNKEKKMDNFLIFCLWVQIIVIVMGFVGIFFLTKY